MEKIINIFSNYHKSYEDILRHIIEILVFMSFTLMKD